MLVIFVELRDLMLIALGVLLLVYLSQSQLLQIHWPVLIKNIQIFWCIVQEESDVTYTLQSSDKEASKTCTLWREAFQTILRVKVQLNGWEIYLFLIPVFHYRLLPTSLRLWLKAELNWCPIRVPLQDAVYVGRIFINAGIGTVQTWIAISFFCPVLAVWKNWEVVAVWNAHLLLDLDLYYQGTKDTKNGISIEMQRFRASRWLEVFLIRYLFGLSLISGSRRMSVNVNKASFGNCNHWSNLNEKWCFFG